MSLFRLDGIDDDAERTRLLLRVEHEMLRRGIWRLIVLVSVFAIATVFLLRTYWGLRLQAIMTSYRLVNIVLASMAASLVASVIWKWWHRHDRRRALVALLKSEARCTGCGYMLTTTDQSLCPECGTAGGRP